MPIRRPSSDVRMPTVLKSAMTKNFFTSREHSALYQQYMVREPIEVQEKIMTYLQEKGSSFELAVDIGCGTGESTRVLVPHFKKVIGVDISETQLEEAKRVASFPNLTYLLGCAENIPCEDGTVDLITASVSAHWFNINACLSEWARVLKPHGCLAMYCISPRRKLQYKGCCSETLTDIYKEAYDFIANFHDGGLNDQMRREYSDIYDAIPFTDKVRHTNIESTYTMSIKTLMGYTKSLFMFQNYYKANPEAATNFLNNLQDSLLKTMGTSSEDTELELNVNYFCVLACKSS